MAVEYLGLSEINGPLVVLEGVQNAAYDEIVEMTVAGNTKKIGRIIEIYGDKAIIQVLRGQTVWLCGIPIQGLRDILWRLPCLRRCWDEPLTESENPLTGWETLFPMCVWISTDSP